MSAIYPTLPKLVVRDSYDDEDLTDIDDEVFIRDGKNGLKLRDDGGVKQPLMAPRRKFKKPHNLDKYRLSNKAFYVPLCFGLMALIILLSLLILCIYIVNVIPMPLSILKNWLSHDVGDTSDESNIVPCTSLASKILWTKSLPKLTSESPLRTTDVNGDGIEDIIIGFSTGLDMINTPEYICALYFEGVPCFGGVLALNGETGDILWIHWTTHAIFSVDCNLDLTNDKIRDCIICGRGGILHAINGHDGSRIWEIPIREPSASEEWKLSDIYDAKFIADIDGDEIGDVIASHTTQSREIHLSEILIISGINGNIIQSSVLPNTEQLFLAPQKLIHPDGESIFVLVTSSQKQSGGLYIIPQVDLMYGNLNLRKLHHNTGKGTLLPPILVDVTLDGIEDIVTAMFNSTIIVYNGLTFEPIWNYTIPNSEVISIPIPGYYNDDDVPDFMVKHQIGSGFPTYYYTVATIIDGKTGKPLLEKPIENSLSKEMSGLSVTVEGFGNDWFLHWSVDCLNYEGTKEKYQFLKSEDLISESRVDLCKLRFNSSLTTTLYALSQHVGPPGISLYFSVDWRSLEYNNSVNSKLKLYANTPFVSERASKINRNPETPIDSQSDNMGNFNHDYILKNGNKWIKSDVQTNKDYDMSYDGNNNINIPEERPIDYSQINEIREERSNIDDRFINKFNINLNNLSDITSTPEQINDYFINFDTTNDKDANTEIIGLGKRTMNILQDNINKIQETTEQTIMNDTQTDTFNIPNTSNKEEVIVQKVDLENRKKREMDNQRGRMYPTYGVQKQPPTGILLPSISKSKDSTSIDLIFSTFWLPSSDVSVILIQEDLDCIHRKKMLSEKKLQYKQNDDIVKECLSERGVDYKTYQETTDRENFKISLGQMTIYRMKLECTCPEDMLPNQSCKNISSHQSWSEYLGLHGSGYFSPLHKTNFK